MPPRQREAWRATAPTRVAVVGTGNIARIHARALATIPAGMATIVAATDAEPGSLASFAAEFGVPATYPDVPGLLDAARPDLVHICTPPSTHHPLALACLRAGASVLVEKPPVISLRELDELAQAEGGNGGPPWLATVFQHRFGGGQRRLKALAAGAGTGEPGVLGRPLLAICHTTWFRGQAYFDVPWRGRWESEGGGPTMGHGIHQIDMLLDILGDWTEVSALARTLARDMPTEDVSLAHVTFASGAVASVVNSVLSPREESYLRFDFEHATVEVTHLYGYRDDDWRVTPAPGHEDVLAAWQAAGPATRELSGHAGQFRQVLAALRDGVSGASGVNGGSGRRPPVALSDARRTMSLIAGIYAAAFTGRVIRPGDLVPGTPFYDAMNGGHARA